MLVRGAGVGVSAGRLASDYPPYRPNCCWRCSSSLSAPQPCNNYPGQRRILVRAGRDNGLLMLLQPLQPHKTMAAFRPAPMALVLLVDSTQRRAPDPLLVAAAYGLTPAEAQMATGVAAGVSLRGIAAAGGVSRHIVRARLAAVFVKVGLRRQAELASRHRNWLR